jgi:competence protein ComEA
MTTTISAALVISTLLLAAPSLMTQAPTAPAPPASKPTINLNTATVAELETLPGIGRKTAELILEHRVKVGGFKKIEELMNVKGIGEKSFLKIKPMVFVAPKPDKAGGDH